jgi:hypothetical protein
MEPFKPDHANEPALKLTPEMRKHSFLRAG